MPIRSMTGFARVSRSTAVRRTHRYPSKRVNHRGLDMHFHMPLDFDSVEPALRTALRKRVVRGHVQVQLFLETQRRRRLPSAAINEALLACWLEAFRAAAARFGLDSETRSESGAAYAGHDRISARRTPQTIRSKPMTLAAAAAALDELDRFRMREGDAIETEIRARAPNADSILVEAMEDIRCRALPYFQTAPARTARRTA